jgi:glucose/arabinose dehydrogenase
VWVDYNGESDNLAVYVSDRAEKPDFALLTTNLALDAIVGNQAYLGFSAATGSAFNNTYIESWVVTLDTPDPNPPTIPSGEIIRRELITGLNQPLNVEWSPDGRNLYVGEKAGIISVSRDGGPLTPLVDISGIVNNVQDRGLVDFEIHPDFFTNPYIYLNYTVDPPEVYNHVGNPLAGPDGSGNRAGRLIRLTLDASTDYTTIVADSGITLLGANSTWNNFNAFVDSTLNLSEPQAGVNPDGSYVEDFINSDSRSHTVGGLTFGGDGALYVGIGDGASFNATDVRATRVQDPNSLSGKVLRIDPETGLGLPGNPFYDPNNPNANRSKVYQLGLRNPWRLATDPRTGRIFIGDTGLVSFEEINTGPAGANFGWPYFEGGQGVNVRTPSYQGLPQAQAFYNSGAAATPAFIAQPHTDGTDVIVLGSVADGLFYGPQYDGDVFYLDFASGTVRHGNIDSVGNLTSVGVFTTGANFVVDLQQGPDGLLYYVDIVSGTVGRFEIV